jgi:hypothetical protein
MMGGAISTVRPEPVEGLSFLFYRRGTEGMGFDKLSPNGCLLVVSGGNL